MDGDVSEQMLCKRTTLTIGHQETAKPFAAGMLHMQGPTA